MGHILLQATWIHETPDAASNRLIGNAFACDVPGDNPEDMTGTWPPAGRHMRSRLQSSLGPRPRRIGWKPLKRRPMRCSCALNFRQRRKILQGSEDLNPSLR